MVPRPQRPPVAELPSPEKSREVSGARYPSLFQANTRVWLTRLSRQLGRPATLDDIPDAELDRLAGLGFDWVWFLSVWLTGPKGQHISRSKAEWRKEFEETLPDLSEEDIGGSGFAVSGYTVHPRLGGDAALARLRERMRRRGLRLLLDFVPNHTALDHPWALDHPEYYVAGSELDLVRAPRNYTRLRTRAKELVLAHGRDPYFEGWPDTLQLNYGNPATQEAMIGVLEKIASQCDGVRCDMAMLVLPEVFERTWGIPARPFWPEATRRARERSPTFKFMAEVYWDLEWTLQQQGFDYTYDKRLYDRLRAGHVPPIRDHLKAEPAYQDKLVRFLENHDEPRAAATFPVATHEAAAVITFLTPGLRLVHEGEIEGRRKRISPHLWRGPDEPVDRDLQRFYERLLSILRLEVVRDGKWQLLECAPAWAGNASWERIIAFGWERKNGERLVAAVNYSPGQSQCYLRLPFPELGSRKWRFQDRLSDAAYDRDGKDLAQRGLYLDLAPWQAHVFSLGAVS